jgi:hypothetical protein
MFLCAAGDIHGGLDRMYSDVLAFESSLGVRFAAVLHVGDFGIWPDPQRVDRATRRHEGAGDFPRWYMERREAPRPTVFIPGNHEDFEFLTPYTQPTALLPGLTYLPNGSSTTVEANGERLRVGGVGGCFGPETYRRPAAKLHARERRHYCREHIDALIRRSTHGRLDVLMTHDAPTGVRLPRHNGGALVSPAEGLADLVKATRPRVCLFGHHHTRVDAEIHGVRCIGLNKGPHPGSLVALDMAADGGHAWQVIGEWPGAGSEEERGPFLFSPTQVRSAQLIWPDVDLDEPDPMGPSTDSRNPENAG